MKRRTLNFIIDLVSFINLLALVFTASIIRYVLPPGTGGLGRGLHGGSGRENIKYFWSLTRHQWGDIHFYLAALFIILMVLHIVLHWKWIKNYLKFLFISSRKKP